MREISMAVVESSSSFRCLKVKAANRAANVGGLGQARSGQWQTGD